MPTPPRLPPLAPARDRRRDRREPRAHADQCRHAAGAAGGHRRREPRASSASATSRPPRDGHVLPAEDHVPRDPRLRPGLAAGEAAGDPLLCRDQPLHRGGLHRGLRPGAGARRGGDRRRPARRLAVGDAQSACSSPSPTGCSAATAAWSRPSRGSAAAPTRSRARRSCAATLRTGPTAAIQLRPWRNRCGANAAARLQNGAGAGRPTVPRVVAAAAAALEPHQRKYSGMTASRPEVAADRRRPALREGAGAARGDRAPAGDGATCRSTNRWRSTSAARC